MYTEEELTALKNQEKKRWITIMVPFALLICTVIGGFIARIELLCDAASLLAGILLLFGWDMYIKPVRRYAAHVDNMLHGISHEVDGEFGSVEQDLSEVDGVRFHAIKLICLDNNRQPYDRLFYYDAQKPDLTLNTGDHIRVTYHDRMAVNIAAL